MYAKPKISKKEAIKIFSLIKRPLDLSTKWRKESLIRIELIFLPYYVFDVVIKGEISNIAIVVDGILGSTLRFCKDTMEYTTTIKEPRCNFVLSEEDAQEIAKQSFKLQRIENGIRSKVTPICGKIIKNQRIYYPFWMGYFQKKTAFDFKAIDALSGELMGVKMRKVFLKAFRMMK